MKKVSFIYKMVYNMNLAYDISSNRRTIVTYTTIN